MIYADEDHSHFTQSSIWLISHVLLGDFKQPLVIPLNKEDIDAYM